MKIQKKSKKKHPIIITIITTLTVIVSAALSYFYIFRPTPENHPSVVQPTPETAAPERAKPENSSRQPQERESEKKPLLQVESSPNQSSQALSSSISHQAVTNGQLILRTTIDQVVASGSCTLILKNSNRTVTKNAPIIQNPSSSSCAGFNIPLAELGTGKWLISIQITSGNQKNIITSSIIL